MTKVKISEDLFSQVLTYATMFHNIGKLRIGEDGIEIHSVDPGEKGRVTVFLNAQGCESLSGPERRIKIDLKTLLDLRSAMTDGRQSGVNILTDQNSFQMTSATEDMKYTGIEKRIISRNLPYTGSPNSATIKFQPGMFGRAMRLTSGITDEVVLAASKADDTFCMIAEEHKSGNDRLRYEFEPAEIISEQNTIQVSFPDDKMNDLAQVIPTDSTVQISLEPRKPAVLEYSFAEGHGYTTIVVCPKVETKTKSVVL